MRGCPHLGSLQQLHRCQTLRIIERPRRYCLNGQVLVRGHRCGHEGQMSTHCYRVCCEAARQVADVDDGRLQGENAESPQSPCQSERASALRIRPLSSSPRKHFGTAQLPPHPSTSNRSVEVIYTFAIMNTVSSPCSCVHNDQLTAPRSNQYSTSQLRIAAHSSSLRPPA